MLWEDAEGGMYAIATPPTEPQTSSPLCNGELANVTKTGRITMTLNIASLLSVCKAYSVTFSITHILGFGE